MTAINNADQYIIVGAGLAGLFTAYHLLTIAKEHHQKINVTILAKEFNYPCGAGSHIINEIDGFYAADCHPSEKLIKELRNGLREIIDLIEDKKINCGLHLSYEMKCKNKQELDQLISDAITKNVFQSNEIVDNSDHQIIHLFDHPYSYHLKSAGQVNVPKLLSSLQKMIVDMGGKILLGVNYNEHFCNDDNIYEIDTNMGVFYTKYSPILATGAEHQHAFIGDMFRTKVIYTMCCVYRLPKMISAEPVAFCDTNLYDDVLWGSVDEQNFLTIGCGAETDKNAKEKIQKKIQSIAQELFPHVMLGEPISVHWGATLHSSNLLPIVKRLPEYEILGAWAGVGIVPGFIAGKAIAEWKLLQKEDRLRILENLQTDNI